MKFHKKLTIKIYFFTFLLSHFLTFSYALFEYKEIFANSGGLCGAFSTNNDHPVVIYYNPAGLFNIPKYSFYFSNTNLYGLEQLASNSFCFSTDVKHLGKLGLIYNSFGFDLYKENFLTFSYANSIADTVSLGVNIKSLSVDIKNYGGKSFTSLDLGVLARVWNKLLLGFVVKDFNMPEVEKDEKVYHTLVVGGKLGIVKDVYTYFDILKPTDEQIFARIGEELKLSFVENFSLFLRAGVETATKDKPAKYSVGIGISYKTGKNEFIVDYSYLQHTVLGGQHIVSLGYNFGKKEEVFVEELTQLKRRRTTTARVAKQPPSKPININTATVEELTQLPGIGPSTAQKIVEYRQQIGKFTSIEQLLDVPRIGNVTLQRIKPYITLGEPQPVKKEEKLELPPTTLPKVEEEKPVVKPEEQKIQVKPVPEEKPVVEEVPQVPVTPQVSTIPQVSTETVKPQQYNINTIEVDELRKLGFTPVEAKNILRYRLRFGRFNSVDDLYKVPNVNPKTVDKIKHLLTVE